MAFNSAVITTNDATPSPLLVQGSGSNQFKNISGTLQDPVPVLITNLDDDIICYLGGPTAASCSYPLLAGQSIPFSLYGQSEIPYAISDSGTPNIAVLAGRQ